MYIYSIKLTCYSILLSNYITYLITVIITTVVKIGKLLLASVIIS